MTAPVSIMKKQEIQVASSAWDSRLADARRNSRRPYSASPMARAIQILVELDADTSRDATSSGREAWMLTYGAKQTTRVDQANGQPSFFTIGLASSARLG